MGLLKTYSDLLVQRDAFSFSAKRLARNQPLYDRHAGVAQELLDSVHRWGVQRGFDAERMVDCYLDLNKMVLEEKIEFLRTKRYSISDFQEACAKVYQNPDYMLRYMIGVALSQIFWESHFRMFCFFLKQLQSCPVEHYLEVGVGHGLFLLFAMRRLPPATRMTGVDISPASLEMARGMLVANGQDVSRIAFRLQNFLEWEEEVPSDFVCMGEILEHVATPLVFLKRARRMLAPAASLYITTAINSPAVDHIYHFHNVAEVEALFAQAGLRIQDALIIPEGDYPPEQWERRLLNVNVAYLLRA